METTTDPLAGLSPRMIEALRSVLRPKPDSIHDEDREPERWVRMEPKPTVQALERRGLLEGWWYDYPCGGYRGRLTDAGMAARAAARSGRGSHVLEILDDSARGQCSCGWRVGGDLTDDQVVARWEAHVAEARGTDS